MPFYNIALVFEYSNIRFSMVGVGVYRQNLLYLAIWHSTFHITHFHPVGCINSPRSTCRTFSIYYNPWDMYCTLCILHFAWNEMYKLMLLYSEIVEWEQRLMVKFCLFILSKCSSWLIKTEVLVEYTSESWSSVLH